MSDGTGGGDGDGAAGGSGGTDGRGGSIREAVTAVRERRGPLAEAIRMVRRELVLSVGIFFAFAVLGYLVVGPAAVAEVPGGASEVDPDCRTPTEGFVEDSVPGYFVNNIGVAVVMMGGLGLLTAGAVAYNGILMGAGWRLAVGLGASHELVAACVFPHVILEVPGLWLAAAIGFFLPGRVVRYALGRREETVDPVEEVHLLQLFALVVGLIFLAAVVEAHVSGVVARALLGPP